VTYKTISDLNSRWWYRLLKVLYILSFVSLIAITNIFIYSFTSWIINIDDDKTLVRCEITEPPEPFSISSIGVKIDKGYFDEKGSFDYRSYFTGYHEHEVKYILAACLDKEHRQDILSGDIYIFQKTIEILRSGKDKAEQKRLLDSYERLIESASYNTEKEKHLDFSTKLFDIIPRYTYIVFLKYFVLANIAVIAVLECLRRIFYYIILGRLRPPKTEQHRG
jgi:hypothetical protein